MSRMLLFYAYWATFTGSLQRSGLTREGIARYSLMPTGIAVVYGLCFGIGQ